MNEYIYFNNENKPIYAASKPMEFENQTLCVKLEFDNSFDRKLVLNAIFGNTKERINIKALNKRINALWDAVEYLRTELKYITTGKG